MGGVSGENLKLTNKGENKNGKNTYDYKNG